MSFLRKVVSKYRIVANAVWYHGRSIDSDKFDLNYVGKDEAKDQEGPGFYQMCRKTPPFRAGI